MDWLTRRQLPGRISRAQTSIILALLPLGLLAILFIPVGAGFDEIQHFRRAWETSAGHLIPNSQLGEAMPVPEIYRQLSYRERPIVSTVEPDYWLRYGSVSLDAAGFSSQGAATRSVYSPPLLAPQSLAVGLFGRALRLPAVPVLYAARLAGLLGYLALAYLAVRMIPFGKWTLTLLAAGPLALFQASTLTADTLSNAIGFLFVGGGLALVGRNRLRWREWGTLVALIALLFLAKANAAPLVLVPLLTVRPGQFEDRRAYPALFGAAAALFLLEVVGWNVLAYPGERIMISDASPVDHLLYVLREPAAFFGGLLGDLAENGIDYLRGWIASYGYYYWSVPPLVYWLWGGGFAAAILADGEQRIPDRRARWVLLGSWLLAYLATAVLLQFINVTPGSGEVRELQGRYFTAVMPLPFLALVGLVRSPELRPPRWLLPAAAIASLVLYVVGMVLSYWVTCGTSYYQFGLCYQPQYKNWSPELAEPPTSPSIGDSTRLAQEFEATCDGLTQVRIWPQASREAVPERLKFELEDLEAEGMIPLRAQGPVGPLDEGWYGLEFEPQPASDGRRYRLSIRPHDPGAGGTGIGFIFTQRPEYRRGQLTVNGEPSEQDLFFQYGCLQGLERVRRSLIGAPGN